MHVHVSPLPCTPIFFAYSSITLTHSSHLLHLLPLLQLLHLVPTIYCPFYICSIYTFAPFIAPSISSLWYTQCTCSHVLLSDQYLNVYCPLVITFITTPSPARSPIYSHLSTSLLGLSTIRAFGKEETSNQYFRQYLNVHSQDWYLYLVTTRWFGMRIDLLTAVFLAVVAFASVPLASSKWSIWSPHQQRHIHVWWCFSPSALNAGLVGLALTYTVSLSGTFQFCVRLSAEVENTVGDVL